MGFVNFMNFVNFEKMITAIFLFLCKYKKYIMLLVIIILTYYISNTIFSIVL